MRKFLLMVLIAALFAAPRALAGERRFVMQDAYGCYVIADEDGKLYTPEGVYEYIRTVFDPANAVERPESGEWDWDPWGTVALEEWGWDWDPWVIAAPEDMFFSASTLAVGASPKSAETELHVLDGFGNVLSDGGRGMRAHDAASGRLIFADYAREGKGLMDERGNVVVEPKYDEIFPNGEGGFLTTLPPERPELENACDPGDGPGLALVHLDADGGEVSTGLRVYNIVGFSEGRAAVRMWVEDGGFFPGMGDNLWGYVSARGELVVPPAYAYAGRFHSGLAEVQLPNGLWGLIRADGSYALEPQYSAIARWEDGDTAVLAYADNYTSAHLIDLESGETVVSFLAEEGFESGRWTWPRGRVARGLYCLQFRENPRGNQPAFALIFDERGGELFRMEGANIMEYPSDIAEKPSVLVATEYGREYLVDLSGARVGAQYSKLIPHCSEGGELRFGARHLGDSPEARWGAIDAGGAEILPVIYQSVESIGNDLYIVSLDGQYGVFHESGVEILPMQYDSLIDAGGGFLHARLADRFGILDLEGNFRISFSDYEVLTD